MAKSKPLPGHSKPKQAASQVKEKLPTSIDSGLPIPLARPQNPLKPGSDAYAVVRWHPDFLVAFGPIPVSEFTRFASGFGKGAVIDVTLGEKFGATLVVARSEAIAEKARHLFAPTPAYGAGLAAWLNGPDVGLSSRFMARHLLGKDAVPVPDQPGSWRDWTSQIYYPHDASDFRRCLKLVEAVPALVPRIEEMASVSPEWAHVVSVWKECEAMYYGDPEGSWERVTELVRQPIAKAGGA